MAKKGQVNATSTSDNETPNPSGTMDTNETSTRPRYISYGDIVLGRESPNFTGGQLVINKSGDEGGSFKDLDNIDKGNKSDEPKTNR
jgi:hypothetical protein